MKEVVGIILITLFGFFLFDPQRIGTAAKLVVCEFHNTCEEGGNAAND